MDGLLNEEIKSLAEFYIENSTEDNYIDLYNKWSDSHYNQLYENEDRLVLFCFAKELIGMDKNKLKDALN